VKEGNAAGMNPYAYVGGNPETDTDPSGQYYSNGTQLGESGGETAYVYNDEIVTVTNTGIGRFTSLSGYSSWNYGSLNVNVSTNVQFNKYGDYNSANDPQYSTAAKFAAVTGWTQLQQSLNAPGATTQSRLMALLHFGETNGNNILQLAAIMGGPDDEGIAAAADGTFEISALAAQAESRAREIGAIITAAKGPWVPSALTVGVATVQDGDDLATLIATNEKASSSLVKLVQGQLGDGEQLVTLADNQGRHAEEVLVQYAQENGLKIVGLGASNNFCPPCGEMLLREVGQQFLGQIVNP
jgi:hypothetical protein